MSPTRTTLAPVDVVSCSTTTSAVSSWPSTVSSRSVAATRRYGPAGRVAPLRATVAPVVLTDTSTSPVTDTSGTFSAMAAVTWPASPAEVSRSWAVPTWVSVTTGAAAVPPSLIVTPLRSTSSTGAPAASVVRVMTTVPVRVWPSTVRTMSVPATRR